MKKLDVNETPRPTIERNRGNNVIGNTIVIQSNNCDQLAALRASMASISRRLS